MASQTRWVETFDDPRRDHLGMPVQQSWEMSSGTPEPVTGVNAEQVQQLNEMQARLDRQAEEARRAADWQRRFPGHEYRRDAADARQCNYIASVQNGLVVTSYYRVDPHNIDADAHGRLIDKVTGSPLMTREQAEAEIAKQRGRRKPQP
jgi:hypothetical protein